MSHSVHVTRREREEVRRWEFGGRASRDGEVWLVEDRLAAKRRYKSRAARPSWSDRSRRPRGV